MKRLQLRFGFTLVELLVVVALIGILAVAVLSTINPIEQANRARDAKYKNDASEIVSATERYYATTQTYPWTSGTNMGLYWSDASLSDNGTNPKIGICGSSGCPSTYGLLISSNELRTEFANRDAFKSTASELDKFYIGRNIGASDSVYVCYVPRSDTKRKSNYTTLKLGSSLGIGAGGTSTTYPPATACTSSTPGYTSLATSCVDCIPQ